MKALVDVIIRSFWVPSSGTDLDVGDGGVGVSGEEVFQDEVVGGVNDGGAVEDGEEGANVVGNSGIGGEGGVEGDLVGTTLIALKRLVELSRIIYQRPIYTLLCFMPSDLVFWDLQVQHFAMLNECLDESND